MTQEDVKQDDNASEEEGMFERLDGSYVSVTCEGFRKDKRELYQGKMENLNKDWIAIHYTKTGSYKNIKTQHIRKDQIVMLREFHPVAKQTTLGGEK